MGIISYHGTYEPAAYTFNNIEYDLLTPQSTGHSRHVTDKLYVAPYEFHATVIPLKITDPGDSEHTGNNSDLDGIHIHFNHLDNDCNFVYSAVRADGHTKISREYDWRDYYDINFKEGLELLEQRRYLIHVKVENEIFCATKSWVGNSHIHAKFPEEDGDGNFSPAWMFGHVGFRLDNVTALVQFTVREGEL